jgi:D-ribose pyranase
MRVNGLWHGELVELIVSMRHHDALVICDAGLPVSSDVRTIDLGWRRGEPRLLPVLGSVLGELVVERATIAEEAQDQGFLAGLGEQLGAAPVDRVPHEEFKARCAAARAVVRTGEDTPYANVMLHAGVPFGGGDGV